MFKDTWPQGGRRVATAAMSRSRPPKTAREENRAWDERWEDWNSWQNPGSADTSTDTATSPWQSEVIPRTALLLGTLPRFHDVKKKWIDLILSTQKAKVRHARIKGRG